MKNLYTIDFETWSIGLEFKLQDVWVGFYWENSYEDFDIWLCLIPCFPIHLLIIKRVIE